MRNKPIPEDVASVVAYNPYTGEMYYRTTGRRAASVTTNRRYLKVRLHGKEYLQHRVAWYLWTGEDPGELQVDHKNLDGTDNRATNLRLANCSQNQQNIRAHTRSTTGIKGIFPVRGGSLYRAEVCIDGRRLQKHSKSVDTLICWILQERSKHHTHVRHE